MSDNLPERKCPFRNPLITREFSCEHSIEVTFREGPGIVCENDEGHARCVDLFNCFKAATLPVLDLEDDLAQIPSGVLNKIQHGGLLALRDYGSQAGAEPGNSPVENINALVMFESKNPEFAELISSTNVVKAITGYKLKKRRGR